MTNGCGCNKNKKSEEKNILMKVEVMEQKRQLQIINGVNSN
ncbi:hypothetical protein [Clostridium sartagoforme]|nr:hypothetical protein [Clostridium sartagoforme]